MAKKVRYKLSVKKLIALIFLFIFLGIFVFSAYKISIYLTSAKDTQEIVETLDDYIEVNTDNEDDVKIDFDKLKKTNSDTVAWIRVNNTNINYPVVRGNDNEYYLKHNFNKKWNEGGWIYSDYRNKFDGTDRNIVIFGHAMKNKTMFGSLINTTHKDWNNDESNRKIQLIINDKVYIYKIFSVYKVQVEDYYINTKFSSDSDYKKFLNTIKDRSMYKYNEDISETKNILTLSTCYDNHNTRLAVHAYLIDVL